MATAEGIDLIEEAAKAIRVKPLLVGLITDRQRELIGLAVREFRTGKLSMERAIGTIAALSEHLAMEEHINRIVRAGAKEQQNQLTGVPS